MCLEAPALSILGLHSNPSKIRFIAIAMFVSHSRGNEERGKREEREDGRLEAAVSDRSLLFG